MVYKYVSIYNVVEKLYRDYDHQEELDIWDVIEWAGEALEFIGAGQQYEKRVAELTIANSMSVLPCNFHSQPQVAYNGKPLSYATGSFSPLSTQTTNTTTNTINGKSVSTSTFPSTNNSLGTDNARLANTFYVRDGVLVTSISEGVVLLEYRAVKTDEDGYPMIPDLQSYRTAVTKYCQMMMDNKDYRKNRVSRDIKNESIADWHWYCGSARGAANMPNLAYMESIKNQWVKLKPNQNAADSFYQSATIREMKKHK